jgi:hypothetical protein
VSNRKFHDVADRRQKLDAALKMRRVRQDGQAGGPAVTIRFRQRFRVEIFADEAAAGRCFFNLRNQADATFGHGRIQRGFEPARGRVHRDTFAQRGFRKFRFGHRDQFARLIADFGQKITHVFSILWCGAQRNSRAGDLHKTF